MSYCSDVKCVLYKRDWERIKNKILSEVDENDGRTYLFKNPDEVQERGSVVIVSWDYARWYEGTDEAIDMFMKFLDKCDEDKTPYHYIRLGEYVDDIEERYNYGFNAEECEAFAIIRVGIMVQPE